MFKKRKKAVSEDKPVIVNVERKPSLVIGCESSNRCADYIIMKSTLESELSKAITEKNLAIAEKEAFVNLLNRLCPDWRQKVEVTK
ncbi:MAG: hypothetical protein IJ731_06810 [Eubacterium sp.]|nr:hypothetical protein [Eubacterium sp.]